MSEPGVKVRETSVATLENPFLSEWDTPFGVPPFEHIEDEHYRPAFDLGLEEQRQRVAAILEHEAPPTFENTILALEQCSPMLDRMMNVFVNLTKTDTNEALKALRSEILPLLTRENNEIVFREGLFERIQAVYDQRERLDLDEQDARLLELTYQDFVRAGAALESGKERLIEINTRLAELTTTFALNVLSETKSFELTVEDEAELAGLPADLVQAGKSAAEVKGKPGAWVFGLDRSLFEAFMTHAHHRELRRRLFDGYRLRAASGASNDNSPVLKEIARLRAERAELLGYPSHAHFVLETTMAKTPERAEELLLKVWKPGLERARSELLEMQEIVDEEGGGFRVEGWDWWFYAEKLRKKKYDFDEEQLKPFFELGNVRRGAFYVAEKLFGLRFERRGNIRGYHPCVETYEVFGRDSQSLGIFLTDDYLRDSKRDGAWMDTFRDASSIGDLEVRPIVVNCMNLLEPAEGAPTLLRFDEVETLFHEFGHGLHGLMTRARYTRFSGTSGCSRDYVELPSQFLEHYASDPDVLAVYARHYETGEVIPGDLVAKLRQARTHNQGFRTTEYIAASLLDLAWHTLSAEETAAIDDDRAFEKKALERYGLIEQIEPRYRSPYFNHIFYAPTGYSAGYYAYLWSEVLDSDAFAEFEKTGDVFHPQLARRLAEHVYEAGYVASGDELYRRFRGQEASVEALLRSRGLDGEGGA